MKTRTYFHEENGQVELRIPLNQKRRNIIRAILEASDENSDRLARDVARFSLDWLDGYRDWSTTAAENYALDSGKDYEQIAAMLRHFIRLGWEREDSMDKLKAEIRERVEASDFDCPEAVEWARGVLATV